ncbi:MAG TPA: hypothetical protein VK936_13865 [Longimicrobiales bacterium]|nr:hypothetical protein [Longimicrobiales bacterium]
MADIRVERKGGGRTWMWVLLAVIVIIVAVVLLDYAGYIDLPFRLGAAIPETPDHAVLQHPAVLTQEA